jgi:hypothetical protein
LSESRLHIPSRATMEKPYGGDSGNETRQVRLKRMDQRAIDEISKDLQTRNALFPPLSGLLALNTMRENGSLWEHICVIY